MIEDGESIYGYYLFTGVPRPRPPDFRFLLTGISSLQGCGVCVISWSTALILIYSMYHVCMIDGVQSIGKIYRFH